MPYQIKNGIIYSGNAVTLTQAQYDALTTAEKNNGTVYYIYDSDAMIEAQEVGLDGGNVETLAGSVATFESSPSTAVHDEGEYILYQAQLYKVTSAIAVGEDLTVGSNIEATNLGNELNNGLTTEEFTLISNQGAAYAGNGIYISATKTVIIHFYGLTSSNVGMNVPLMTVPEAYRPSAEKTGYAFMFTDNTGISGALTLHTNGTITQASTGYLRRIHGTIFYALD